MSVGFVTLDKSHSDEAHEISMRLAGRHAGRLCQYLELVGSATKREERQQELHPGLDRLDSSLRIAWV
jgi:hypothetical protein